MNFSLSEEQRLVKESAERFVGETCAVDRRRALVASALGYSERTWRQMAELGWLGVNTPEAYGGSGGGPVETMVLMEAFGAGLVLEPYFPSVILGGNLVAMAGSEAQKRAILPALAAGARKLAFAWVEAQSGYDLFDVSTTAARRPWRLRDRRGQGCGVRRRRSRHDHRLRAHEGRPRATAMASVCSSSIATPTA